MVFERGVSGTRSTTTDEEEPIVAPAPTPVRTTTTTTRTTSYPPQLQHQIQQQIAQDQGPILAPTPPAPPPSNTTTIPVIATNIFGTPSITTAQVPTKPTTPLTPTTYKAPTVVKTTSPTIVTSPVVIPPATQTTTPTTTPKPSYTPVLDKIINTVTAKQPVTYTTPQIQTQTALDFVVNTRNYVQQNAMMNQRIGSIDKSQQYVMSEAGPTWSKGQILTGQQIINLYTGSKLASNLAYSKYSKDTSKFMKDITYYPKGTTFTKTNKGLQINIPGSETALAEKMDKKLSELPPGVREIVGFGSGLSRGAYSTGKIIASFLGRETEYDIGFAAATGSAFHPFDQKKMLEYATIPVLRGKQNYSPYISNNPSVIFGGFASESAMAIAPGFGVGAGVGALTKAVPAAGAIAKGGLWGYGVYAGAQTGVSTYQNISSGNLKQAGIDVGRFAAFIPGFAVGYGAGYNLKGIEKIPTLTTKGTVTLGKINAGVIEPVKVSFRKMDPRNLWVKAGAKRIPPEDFIDKKVLAGESIFPTAKNVPETIKMFQGDKDINTILKSNEFYHGTAQKNIPNIMKTGLKTEYAGGKLLGGDQIFLTKDMNLAKLYSDVGGDLLKVSLTDAQIKRMTGSSIAEDISPSQISILNPSGRIDVVHATASFNFSNTEVPRIDPTRSTDVYGTYVSPKGHASGYFLRLGTNAKDFTYSPVSVSFLPKKPSFRQFSVEGITRAPKGVRTDTQRFMDWQLKNPILKAVITSARETGKMEAEAVINPGVKYSKLLEPKGLLQKIKGYEYYTEFKGRKIPIYDYKVTEGKTDTSTIKGLLKQTKATQEYFGGKSIYNPTFMPVIRLGDFLSTKTGGYSSNPFSSGKTITLKDLTSYGSKSKYPSYSSYKPDISSSIIDDIYPSYKPYHGGSSYTPSYTTPYKPPYYPKEPHYTPPYKIPGYTPPYSPPYVPPAYTPPYEPPTYTPPYTPPYKPPGYKQPPPPSLIPPYVPRRLLRGPRRGASGDKWMGTKYKFREFKIPELKL